MTKTNPHPTRTVVVLGSAYGGVGAIGILAQRLPADWQLVVIDRQTHINHVYPFPRCTLFPKHAPKTFIPLTNILTGGRILDAQPNVDEKLRTGAPLPPVNDAPGPRRQIHGIITGLSRNSVTVVHANAAGNFDDIKDDGSDAPEERVEVIGFDYCIYALGGTLSAPADVWGDNGRKQYPGRGSKTGGIAWLTRYGGVIAEAKRIVVVGGGALGIQFATDIKETNPEKSVTLLHSRERLMPIYSKDMHDAVVRRCGELGITLVLGERVTEWPANPDTLDGTPKVVKTDKGSELTGDIVLVCTGTKPTATFIRALDPNTVADNGCVRIKDTMQIRQQPSQSEEPDLAALSLEDGSNNFDHMFAIGDCADTTAIRAGHMAFAQGGVAGRNVLRLIDATERGEQAVLEKYEPAGPLLKLSLGLKHYCLGSPESVKLGDDGVEDLVARGMWQLAGAQDCADDH